MHRIGGLEKEDVTGNVSYDPQNHQKMVNLRAQKVANVAVPELNMGQLLQLVRARYLVDAQGINKVQGKPFTVGELVEGIERYL